MSPKYKDKRRGETWWDSCVMYALAHLGTGQGSLSQNLLFMVLMRLIMKHQAWPGHILGLSQTNNFLVSCWQTLISVTHHRLQYCRQWAQVRLPDQSAELPSSPATSTSPTSTIFIFPLHSTTSAQQDQRQCLQTGSSTKIRPVGGKRLHNSLDKLAEILPPSGFTPTLS